MRLFLILLLTINLLQAKKIALLIGNSDYSFAPLANPLNDVDGIYQTLKEIGFDISQKDVLKNASQSKMQKALANFSQRAKDAEIALVYFSGHGMQVNNKNYMFPARTTATKPVDLFGLVDLDYFIQSASSAKYGIILVDACRNNPLVKYFQNGRHKGSNAKKGLGQVTPTVGQVVIGFATSAGDTADDGSGSMSPYARALSVRLKEPNKDITKVLGLVALDVSVKYEQNPVYEGNLAYDVILNGGYNQNFNPLSSNSRFLRPSRSLCMKYGGKEENGECQINWDNATKLCKESELFLPSRANIHSFISDCGGIQVENFKSYNKNYDNEKYQLCYKKLGFKKMEGYWTREEYKSSNAWSVFFKRGTNTWVPKSFTSAILCTQ
jgi:hypothetical protein